MAHNFPITNQTILCFILKLMSVIDKIKITEPRRYTDDNDDTCSNGRAQRSESETDSRNQNKNKNNAKGMRTRVSVCVCV